MYDINDTIVAVSSPTNDNRVILRLTGPETIEILNRVFSPAVVGEPGITHGKILALDCLVYLFRNQHSYTGDDLAEIHIWANASITEHVFDKLLSLGARPAEPGEFTSRAYLNNKIDLAQAEAVNEIITASNAFQLTAAENLLAGHFGSTIEKIASTILDCLCRLEAGLDFSADDIGQADPAEIIAPLAAITGQLRDLLAGSVRCEATIDLPAVAIAGCPGAGKSTLLNKLLGRQRSIVSAERKTTRDVLTGEITIQHCRCVLFDCAGLMIKPENILDDLAQQAAVSAIQNSIVVIFCVDITKTNWSEDIAVRDLFHRHRERNEHSESTSCHCERSEAISLITVATKCDLLSQRELTEKTSQLNSLFACDFLPISAHAGLNLDKLKSQIANHVIAATSGQNKEGVALTARHRQAVTSAIADLVQAVDELKAGNDEVAAMMLRTAHNQLGLIEQHQIDEQLLDRIFSRFCIGK